MDRNNLVKTDLKPVVFSKSPIINNSGSDTDSSVDASKNVKSHSELTRSKHRRSSSHKKSKHHKSKRSRSRDHHISKSRRSRSKDHSNKYKSSGYHKKPRDSSKSDKRKQFSKERSRSPRFDSSTKKSHREDRKKKYKDSSPRRANRHNDDTSKAADETSGVKLPCYLNSAAVNPTKYAEIEQKRKLLWSKKDDSKKLNIEAWNASSVIASRGDDKKAAKFRKLMGIHDEPNAQSTIDLSKKEHEQAVLFNRLDADYQSARSHTHTSRGVGLGYNQSAFIDPHSYLAGRRDDN